MEKRNPFRKILSFIMLIIVIYIFIQVYGIYKEKNLNDFVRAEQNLYSSKFSRDFNVKYGEKASYKIESPTYNDAMIFKEMEVTPNTSYKVSCLVKTENVVAKTPNKGGGAQISIEGTVARSNYITGTNDWTELTLYFNSKNQTKVNIGFRLGGYDDVCTGTAWFDNISVKRGVTDTSNEWNYIFLIFNNLNVTLNQDGIMKEYRISMGNDEIQELMENMARFKNSFEEFSAGKMQINYDIIQIYEPITSLSYDEKNAYYVSPEDIHLVLDKYLSMKEYDHIFIGVKLGDLSEKIEIPVNDWIGLGGMEYKGLGFSNIRLPNNNKSYVYRYAPRVNEFPEEVFVHEFLHTFERNSKEFGYERPELHDNEKYGYKNQKVTGLKQWYIDYMNHTIKDSNGNTYGLDPVVYTLKPVQESDFSFFTSIDIEHEPQNIIEEIRDLVKNFIRLFQKVKLNYINEQGET